MSKKQGKHWGKLVFLGIFCLLSALIFVRSIIKIELYQEKIFIKTNFPIEKESAKQLVEENRECVLWGSQKNQKIYHPFTQKAIDVEVITCLGREELLFSNAYFDKGKENGCMIDRATGEKLFGTADLIGQTIWYNAHKYTVQDILEEKEYPVLYIMYDEKMANEVSNIMFFQNEYTERELIVKGIDGRTVEFKLLKDILILFFAIVPYIILGIKILKKGYRWKETKNVKYRVFGSVIFWILFVIIWCAPFIIFEIPEYLRPSVWSDITQWKEIIENVKGELRMLISIERSAVVLPCFHYFVEGIVAGLSFWISCIALKIKILDY